MNRGSLRAFTLVELLVTLAVISVLLGLGLAATGSVRARADAVACQQKMRNLGSALFLYAADHQGSLPRSNHSAFAHREPGWVRAIFPYLGQSESASREERESIIARDFVCPSDRDRTQGSSYGLNVYFELDPDVDDYPGSPSQWGRLAAVPHPGRTILLAELKSFTSADHVMAHFWEGTGSGGEVESARHGAGSHYLFADGSLARMTLRETFDPEANLDLWNPGRAGQD